MNNKIFAKIDNDKYGGHFEIIDVSDTGFVLQIDEERTSPIYFREVLEFTNNTGQKLVLMAENCRYVFIKHTMQSSTHQFLNEFPHYDIVRSWFPNSCYFSIVNRKHDITIEIKLGKVDGVVKQVVNVHNPKMMNQCDTYEINDATVLPILMRKIDIDHDYELCFFGWEIRSTIDKI